jgi:hypothetical protein
MNVHIQIKDKTGSWLTVRTVPNQDQILNADLNSVQKQYKMDVRAMDKNGLLLQYLPYIK